MPGHVKKSTGPDPDPTEFLFISAEMRMADQTKPYDAKKSCWVPDPTEGFVEGNIQGTKGDTLVSVQLKNGAVNDYKKDLVVQVNPPKYEKCEDVSNLTFLNDASVLYNLKSRYQAKLIYTYSGLFCIVINPYKRYPIYTNRAVKIYQGKRRNEVPPHLFAICDGAYMDMLQAQQNQSMLITGESGAGKTENTKKVLSYFANVGATTSKKDTGVKKPNLEDQIVETNPPLEAYGNAKTTRNDNSSRFGKFIRTHFAPNGKLSGADIEVYLLEKARVIDQTPVERGYHIFYQMMSDQVDYIKKLCKLTNDIYDYPYQCKGQVVVQSIDDKEDMEFTHKAFDILNFTNTERDDCYKLTASVMHMGNLKFKQKGREEQAEADGTAAGEIMGELYGVDYEKLYTNLCKPKIKVGAEFVTQGRNVDQVNYSVGALAKALFDRVFKWIVAKCNKTLETGQKRATFIGVLDIAGFEIFDFNGFEQICINFCNEKLQQFFNHHMFVLEQEEYKAEGIDWVFVDFGMDLQACIELFEKKLGLLAILEEESMFPKATDKSFEEKLKSNHLGKSPPFIKPKPPKPGQAEGHFAICHYAGIVTYNLSGWLEKNKDPLNDTVVDQLKKSTCELMVTCFADHPGQSAPAEPAGGKKKKGAGGFKTVSSAYREQLNSLMTTLHSTHPHFIRCIVPNTTKTPGKVEPELIMHQLTCNGVLEGIRICQKGFPNRMPYSDFKQRYNIIAAKEMLEAKNDKEAAQNCFAKAGLEEELWRVGNTKVFFRAGVLGRLEEVREDRIGLLMTWLQSVIRGWSTRKYYAKLQKQRTALLVVQRNIRKYKIMAAWPWYAMWVGLRPRLSGAVQGEEELNRLEEDAVAAEGAIGAVTDKKNELQDVWNTLNDEKNAILEAFESAKGGAGEYMKKIEKLMEMKADAESQLADVMGKLANEKETKEGYLYGIKKIDGELEAAKGAQEHIEGIIKAGEDHKAMQDQQYNNLGEEVTHQEELIAKLGKEKKHLFDCNQKTAEDATAIEDKCNLLAKLKSKLEAKLDELEDNLEREKKLRGDSEKAKRKAEGDLKLSQEAIGDLERNYKEYELVWERKEKEYAAIFAKIEDEGAIVYKDNRTLKELAARYEELQDEYEHEHNGRAKAEKAKSLLARDLAELAEKVDEAGGATAQQIELNKKREGELAKVKRDIEEQQLQHEAALASLRKKHNDTLAEMSDQIDYLNKIKARVEKDKDGIKRDYDDAKAAYEALFRDKNAAEKTTKCLQHTYGELFAKLDEVNKTLSDYDAAKKKLACENAELYRQLEESDSQYAALSRTKFSLTNQLDDMRKLYDDESRARTTLYGKFKNLESDIAVLRDQYDAENDAKADVLKLYSKVNAEALMWRSKYESEGYARCEELEAAKGKLASRLEEAEQQIDALNVKNLQLEKGKARAAADYDDLVMTHDKAYTHATALEKKQKNFDKILNEWKLKYDDLHAEWDAVTKEARNYATEHFRLKTAYDENIEAYDAIKRENKNLADEVKDLMDQIGDGGRAYHESQKNYRRLELEKEELAAALEEAEAALEQEENKVLRVQLELGQVRQEIDRRIAEKEDEFENTRKCHAKAIESMQTSLEVEAKAKADAIKLKKKLEADINELEISLDHANKANSDLKKHHAKIHDEYLALESKVKDEHRLASEYREGYGMSERRANALHGELEETRTLLEASDRARRNAEGELFNTKESIGSLYASNYALGGSKRKLENEMATLQADMEEMLSEAKNSEEKAKKAMLDAARLADELRSEQEHYAAGYKIYQVLEKSYKDLTVKYDEVEAGSAKSGKKAVASLELKYNELYAALNDESSKYAAAMKNVRKCERRIKELSFQYEEDRKNHDRMTDLVDKLQLKLKTYKKQIEEAEEVAALNLAKYRKAYQELEERGGV